jgi:hypothetical protein
VAGLALAVAGLLSGNILATGLQLLLVGDGSGDLGPYAMALGAGAALPAVIALFLVREQARGPVSGWPGHVSRAAAVVAFLVLVGAALAVLGGLLRTT